VEFYPDVIDKAAVLCVRLARNHPLPDGNQRVRLDVQTDVPLDLLG
jgi:prophage maintenance system killer protein